MVHKNQPRADGERRLAAVPARAPQLDIIWNVTSICGWNCAACCVSARQVTQRGGKVLISSPELDRHEVLAADPSQGTAFDQALRHLQRRGVELTLARKLEVLEHLAGHDVRLDISGGDALSPQENVALLSAASAKLGRRNVTLTATGAGLAHYDVGLLASLIDELNFTFDGEPDPANPLRPSTYAQGNLRRARGYAAAGVSVRAECPLSAQNLQPEALGAIYRQLHDADVDKLLLMRLFPVGRGTALPGSIPTNDQYRAAIATLRELEARYRRPAVKLQCALRLMEGPQAVNPCDAFTESFGLLWDGTLLGSPWALNKSGAPIDDAWVLGNLADESLTRILASDKVRRARARAAENHGQCKIFAWLNGSSGASEDRMFELADPMYAGAPARLPRAA
jgi:MoaA/NifB/PqqE/SkfB family radical SAM enzyme